MTYIVSDPPEYLKFFVQYFWETEFKTNNGKSFTHISTASSSSGLQFYYAEGFKGIHNRSLNDFERTAIFYGQKCDAQDYVSENCAGIFGVKFYPYAIFPLFGIHANELTDQVITLNSLFGQKGSELVECIFLTDNYQQRVNVMIQFLANRIYLMKPLDQRIINAVDLINSQNGNINLESISKTVFLSERQLEREFKKFVGLSPKSYSKIVRFEYAKNCYETSLQSLTDIAISCGYYDQAHFNKDFKKLSGYNPNEYYNNYKKLNLL